MRFYKLRVTPDAASKASVFNEQFKPEIIPQENDPFRTNWIQEPSEDDFLVGEQVTLRPTAIVIYNSSVCLFPIRLSVCRIQDAWDILFGGPCMVRNSIQGTTLRRT
jgi:hypothetical protein